MQCSLCVCPLKLTLFFAKVLLPCECNLQVKETNEVRATSSTCHDVITANWSCFNLYPLLDDKIPSLSTQSITNDELDEVKRDVEYKIVQPYNTSPTPSNPFNSSKAPICIDSYQGGNLQENPVYVVPRRHFK